MCNFTEIAALPNTADTIRNVFMGKGKFEKFPS
jgi:hypothetical protein